MAQLPPEKEALYAEDPEDPEEPADAGVAAAITDEQLARIFGFEEEEEKHLTREAQWTREITMDLKVLPLIFDHLPYSEMIKLLKVHPEFKTLVAQRLSTDEILQLPRAWMDVDTLRTLLRPLPAGTTCRATRFLDWLSPATPEEVERRFTFHYKPHLLFRDVHCGLPVTRSEEDEDWLFTTFPHLQVVDEIDAVDINWDSVYRRCATLRRFELGGDDLPLCWIREPQLPRWRHLTYINLRSVNHPQGHNWPELPRQITMLTVDSCENAHELLQQLPKLRDLRFFKFSTGDCAQPFHTNDLRELELGLAFCTELEELHLELMYCDGPARTWHLPVLRRLKRLVLKGDISLLPWEDAREQPQLQSLTVQAHFNIPAEEDHEAAGGEPRSYILTLERLLPPSNRSQLHEVHIQMDDIHVPGRRIQFGVGNCPAQPHLKLLRVPSITPLAAQMQLNTALLALAPTLRVLWVGGSVAFRSRDFTGNAQCMRDIAAASQLRVLCVSVIDNTSTFRVPPGREIVYLNANTLYGTEPIVEALCKPDRLLRAGELDFLVHKLKTSAPAMMAQSFATYWETPAEEEHTPSLADYKAADM